MWPRTLRNTKFHDKEKPLRLSQRLFARRNVRSENYLGRTGGGIVSPPERRSSASLLIVLLVFNRP